MNGQFIGCGANFARDDDLFLGRQWLKRGPVEVIDRCPCLLGACYIIPASVYHDLDGINPNFQGWGYGEQDLSLRAWIRGYEVRRINGLVVQHRFNRGLRGTFLSTWHNQYNAMVTAATVFEDGVFEKNFETFFRHVYSETAIEQFDNNIDAIRNFRDFVQDTRRVSDSELYGLCDYRIPTTSEQRQRVDKILRMRVERRKDRKENPKPWDGKKLLLGKQHREAILKALPPGGRMLEYGSGYTTTWFRSKLTPHQSLKSVEHSSEWSKRVGPPITLVPLKTQIGKKGEQLVEGWEAYVKQNGVYDVILVDGVLRNECLKWAYGIVKPGGKVFLHDSQRDWYDESLKNYLLIQEYDSCDDYPGPKMKELTVV